MRNIAGAVIVIAVALPLLFAVLPDLMADADLARTEGAIVADGCSTVGVATSCELTLPVENAYSTMDGMAVTETSPGAGDKTAVSSLAADRVTLTVGSLATSTAFTFTVTHRIVDPDISGQANEALSRYGILIVMAVIGVILFWGYRTFL